MLGISLTTPSKIDPQPEQRPRTVKKCLPCKVMFAFLNTRQQGSFVCKKKCS